MFSSFPPPRPSHTKLKRPTWSNISNFLDEKNMFTFHFLTLLEEQKVGLVVIQCYDELWVVTRQECITLNTFWPATAESTSSLAEAPTQYCCLVPAGWLSGFPGWWWWRRRRITTFQCFFHRIDWLFRFRQQQIHSSGNWRLLHSILGVYNSS